MSLHDARWILVHLDLHVLCGAIAVVDRHVPRFLTAGVGQTRLESQRLGLVDEPVLAYLPLDLVDHAEHRRRSILQSIEQDLADLVVALRLLAHQRVESM